MQTITAQRHATLPSMKAKMYRLLPALLLLSGCANVDWDRVGKTVTAAANGYSQGLAQSHYQQRVGVTQDYDWAWDQFYGQGYQLVWVCRGIQTGQFAEESKCAYKVKYDSRWPGNNYTN